MNIFNTGWCLHTQSIVKTASQNRNMLNKEEEVERCKLAEKAERFVVI
jgi:hypothetical protein